MTKYQQREENYNKGFESQNIRRTLLGVKKGTQKWEDIMAGHSAAKRERIKEEITVSENWYKEEI